MKRRVLAAGLLLLGSACGPASGSRAAATGTGDVSNPAAERFPLAVHHGACGNGGLTALGLERIGRAPYLQNATASSAEVLFTIEPGHGPVTVRLTEPGGRALASAASEPDPADPSGRQQLARFTALEPGQVYCYALEGLTAPIAFSSALPPGSPVRFVVFGDSGGGPLQSAVRDEMQSFPFDLMLHVGDLAYGSGTLEQLESQFFDVYEELLATVPVFPTTGNHDYGTGDGAPFRQVFSLPDNGVAGRAERWYSFDWGDVHFVALDTELVGPEQRRWLEEDLERNVLPWTVVYLHRPPYSSGDHGSSGGVRSVFGPVFEAHGVDVVFAGHDHHYERVRPIGGVSYIVTGGGGRSTRGVGRSSFTAFGEDVLHFVYVEATEERMVLHAIDATGREFDSLRLDRAAGSALD